MDAYGEPDRPGRGAPMLVFTAIIVLSLFFFFLFTLPRCSKVPNQVESEKDPSTKVASESQGTRETPGSLLGTPVNKEGETLGAESTSQTSTGQRQPDRSRSPQLVKDFATTLEAGDPTATLALIPDLKDEEKAFLRQTLESGVKPRAGSGPSQVGQLGDKHRWVWEMTDAGGTDAGRLYLDVVRGADRTWSPSQLQFSQDLISSIGQAARAKGVEPITVAAADVGGVDALQFSEKFVRTLLAQEFQAAQEFTDSDKIAREKLAGLVIVFEEQKYSLAADKPLMATAVTDEAAWVVVRVESEGGEKSDFGLELNKGGNNQWRVAGMNFSKLLASYARSAGAGDIPYTPMVENPEGGESLVLFFGYDEADLHQRAQRQLEIVAKLLMGDATKSIRISGHADAMGSEDYNFQLSNLRAVSVRQKLISLGVNASQIITEGFGEASPLKPNALEDGTDNPAGRSQNRRTEIFLDF